MVIKKTPATKRLFLKLIQINLFYNNKIANQANTRQDFLIN